MISKNFILMLAFLFLIQLFPNIAFSLDPDEILDNKKLEIKARIISKNIRCLVCQNQSIDESNSPLAKDLRTVIREKLLEGKNDDEIYSFLTDRYGDFILLKPPFKLITIALWFLPFSFLLIGLFQVLAIQFYSYLYFLKLCKEYSQIQK